MYSGPNTDRYIRNLDFCFPMDYDGEELGIYAAEIVPCISSPLIILLIARKQYRKATAAVAITGALSTLSLYLSFRSFRLKVHSQPNSA